MTMYQSSKNLRNSLAQQTDGQRKQAKTKWNIGSQKERNQYSQRTGNRHMK